MLKRSRIISLAAASVVTSVVALGAPASMGVANAMPVARAGISTPTPGVETVVYRRRYTRGRVYRRGYGYNPGPGAIIGAIAGIAGAGIAASQRPSYYGYGYPAYGYGNPYGYGGYRGYGGYGNGGYGYYGNGW